MTDFLEKTLENIIYNNQKGIEKRGLTIGHRNLMKQIALPSGKYIDLLAFDINEHTIDCTIYELKKEKVTFEALFQIANYAVELRHALEPYFERTIINKVLIGNDCNPGIAFLNNEVFSTEIYTYEYLVDGIYFKQLAKTSTLAGTDTGFNVFQPKIGSESLVYMLLEKALEKENF